MENNLSFEAALKELETIVAKLESGEESLEDSIALYDRGMKLSAFCNQTLQNAQQRILTLAQAEEENNADNG